MTQKYRSGERRPAPSRRRQLSRGQRDGQRARLALVVAAVVVLIILAIPAYGYYATFVAPPREWVLQVNDATFTRGDMVKMIRLDLFGETRQSQEANVGNMPFQAMQKMLNRELIRQGSPRYNIAVSNEDIDVETRLRILPVTEGSEVSPEELESEFQERYRQYLNVIQLSEKEHREIVAHDLWQGKLREILGQEVSTVLPQVRLYSLDVDSADMAREAQTEFARGATFEDLVERYSIITEAVRQGGEIGWIPRGVRPDLDDLIFGLEPGVLSEPRQEFGGGSGQEGDAGERTTLYLITEKAEAREVDPLNLEVLKTRALEAWLGQERENSEVRTRFDSDIYEWVLRQLSLSPGRTQ
jgi:hypothetical protein